MALKLKLELKWTKIRRVITVPTRLTLVDLNDVIQVMFGFEHDHLWNFQSQDAREWDTGCDPLGGRLNMDMRGILDPYEYFIDDVLTAVKAQLLYSYDYGDGWKIVRGPTKEELTEILRERFDSSTTAVEECDEA